MSRLSQIVSTIRKAAALLLLPLLASSCHWMNEDYDCEETADSRTPQYINVTIAVSASDSPVTRAPLGGEYGDGREKGIETRENEVDGVTLIFYQDAIGTEAGINATAANAEATTIDLAVYYPVTRDDGHDDIHPTDHTDEVFYTTGEQQLNVALNTGNKYRLLIVANADLTGNITETTTLAQLREMVATTVYTGTGIGIAATKFIMSSEQEELIDFRYSSYDQTNNKRTFTLDNVHMERMAARIDYCTKGATFDSNLGGYKYNVGSEGAFFVVTKVTPFNLYNESEYLFKRIQNSWTGTPTTNYLGSEGNSTTNYFVVDPNTANKDNASDHTFSYLNPIAENMTNSYTQDMSNLSTGQTFTDQSNYNNVIIAYPKENTLKPTSHLKKYATGLAFETKYYASATAAPVTRVYYYYLRHQGEQSTGAYQAKQWRELTDNETCTNEVPMNFGIVRNNIYRVSVESLSPVDGTIKIRIEEKHWRHVDNPVIYL